jgi:hypothetical protein
MEAIPAFSLACNVIQVVDFSLKATSMCHEAYKTGQVTAEFRAAYEVLQQARSPLMIRRYLIWDGNATTLPTDSWQGWLSSKCQLLAMAADVTQ